MNSFLKTIIIGVDKGGPTACKMGLPVRLSENSTCYWILDSETYMLPIEMYVDKRSPLGVQIAGIVKRFNVSELESAYNLIVRNEFINLIDEVIFTHLTVEDVRNMVAAAKKQSFEDGVSHARMSVKSALGL
jgi:hypothetical protein